MLSTAVDWDFTKPYYPQPADDSYAFVQLVSMPLWPASRLGIRSDQVRHTYATERYVRKDDGIMRVLLEMCSAMQVPWHGG